MKTITFDRYCKCEKKIPENKDEIVIYCLGGYVVKNLQSEKQIMSKHILSLKEGSEDSIIYFKNEIENRGGLDDDNYFIAVVPSSNPNKTHSRGMQEIVKHLVQGKKNIKDGSDLLIRTKAVAEVKKGDRSQQKHEESIELNKNKSVTGQTVLLLDDVVTSGRTMYVCRKKLLEGGCKEVVLFALTYTVTYSKPAYKML